MRILSNDTVARIVLYRLYAKPTGVNVPNIPALKGLCGSKMDMIPDRTLATIVAGSPAGLLGHGLVTCKPGGSPTCPFGALDIELTDEGRAWVELHSASGCLHRIGAWLVEHVAAAVISAVIGGALAGGLGGWFLRGLLER